MNYETEIITCNTCGKSDTRFHTNTFVQRMWKDGDKYFGSPLTRGHIVISGNACFTHAMSQADKQFYVGKVQTW